MRKKVLTIISAMICIFTGGYLVGIVSRGILSSLQKRLDKTMLYYKLLNEWLLMQQKGITLNQYFERKNCKKIAIYGMGELGKRLFDELSGTGIEIVCIIDQSVKGIYDGIKIITPEEEIQSVDAIVVTAYFNFKDIYEKLSESVNCPIISLEKIIYEMRDTI